MLPDNNQPAVGASGLRERRSDGIAGSSREVSKMDAAPCAGTVQVNNGCEKGKTPALPEATSPVKPPVKKPVLVERKTELSGCGVTLKKKTRLSVIEQVEELGPGIPQEELENHGDLLFVLFDRMDRIAARQDLKFERFDRRITDLEEQGRAA